MTSARATIATALRWPGLDPIDARVLLQHSLGATHAYLIGNSERMLTSTEEHRVRQCFERRIAGEPVAYIVGQREFFGRDYRVSPAVLIPRPETELLVELGLQKLEGINTPKVLDLGTGSGCVGITLALERADASIVTVDRSADALAIAAENARSLGAANVSFLRGDWFGAIGSELFDLIVSNPPYVEAADPHLSQGDLRFEPQSALAAGPTGLDAITTIVGSARGHLRPGGWVLVEHGWNQAEAVADLLASAGFGDRFLAHDLAGQPRVSGGRASWTVPSGLSPLSP